ncbi:toxin-antitoxin system HicB family antitoxin, partial [bacterium LRH843]|nr:toxin-antitoxin system HicB family antitoxin [bacterium LRH843]
LNKKPDQPFKGTFNVRISPDLHRKAVLASSNSLNNFVSDAIQEKLMRLGV